MIVGGDSATGDLFVGGSTRFSCQDDIFQLKYYELQHGSSFYGKQVRKGDEEFWGTFSNLTPLKDYFQDQFSPTEAELQMFELQRGRCAHDNLITRLSDIKENEHE